MASKSSRGRLVSQKDGRAYAIRVLARLQNAGGSDEHVICPFNADSELEDASMPLEYYRTGPQSDAFAKDVLRLFASGSIEAQKGFLAILTDCFSGAVNMDLDFYRRLERRGLLQNLGERGDAMPLPVARGSWDEVERMTGWRPDATAST